MKDENERIRYCVRCDDFMMFSGYFICHKCGLNFLEGMNEREWVTRMHDYLALIKVLCISIESERLGSKVGDILTEWAVTGEDINSLNLKIEKISKLKIATDGETALKVLRELSLKKSDWAKSCCLEEGRGIKVTIEEVKN